MTIKGAESLGVPRHLVEQDRRRAAAAFFSQHLRDRAHLGVPMSAVDAHELTHSVDLLEPSPEVAIVAVHLRRGLCAPACHLDLLNCWAIVYILIPFSE